MTPRRITALLALVAVVCLAWGAFSRRWYLGEHRSASVNGNVRIGLTGISLCIATVEATECDSIEFSRLEGRTAASGWMWFGRLTFGLALAAALVLAAIAVMSLLNIDLHAPISLPRWALRCSLAVLPFLAGYYLFTPTLIGNHFETGRGFLLVGLGAVAGIVAAGREREDRWG